MTGRDYRSILDALTHAVIAADRKGRIVYANRAAEVLLGWPVDEFLGRSLTAFFACDLPAVYPTALSHDRSPSTSAIIGHPMRVLAYHRDGTKVNVDLTLTVCRVGEEDLLVTSLQASCEPVEPRSEREMLERVNEELDRTAVEAQEEIAARRQAEAALRESEERFRILSELISDYAFAYRIEPDGTIHRQWTTGAFTRITGYTPEELDAIGWHSLHHPADEALFRARLEALKAGRLDVREWRILSKEGETLWVRDVARPVPDPEGGGVQVYGAAQDITERKRAAQEIEVQAHLLASVEQAVIATDLRGTITCWNRFAETLYGWSAEEVRGLNILDVTPAEISSEQAAAIMVRLRGGESWTGEFMVRRRHGTTFPARVTDSPIYSRNGSLIGIVGISSDLTERKRTEEALRRANERLVLLSETAGQLLLSHPPDELLERAFQLISLHLGLEIYFNYRVADDTTRLRLACYGGVSEEIAQQLQWLESGESICGQVAQERTPIVAENIPQSADERTRLLRSLGITAYVCYPLLAHGGLIGTLSFGTRSRPRFEPDELALMQTISNQIAMALERAQWIAALPEGRLETCETTSAAPP